MDKKVVMKYTINELLLMDEMMFNNTFSQVPAVIEFADGTLIEGVIEKIELSTIKNPDTQDNLPVSIKINGRDINIDYRIKCITI